MGRPRKDPSNHAPARGRGRPLGSAPFREVDEALLTRYADKALHTPGLQLAPFARSAGWKPAPIRRLQARWRAERDRLLNDARKRFDARPPDSLGQLVMDMWVGLGRAAGSFSGILKPLKASMLQAQRRWDALGDAAQLPLDPTNPDILEPALARFENAMPTPGSNEMDDLLGVQTFEDLPFSMRLYVLAVLLHEVSLEERRREAEPGRSGPGKLS
jgi:hypothetical protein